MFIFASLKKSPPLKGSNMHVDPMFTSAWNTLLCGRKKWVLFPPSDDVTFKANIGAPTKDDKHAPPAYWWLDIYPKLKASGMDKKLGMVECLQKPGETIFVPAGWWHAVLNLDFTIAITQNLLLPASIKSVWPSMVAWKEFGLWFAKSLRKYRPDVYANAAHADIVRFLEENDDGEEADYEYSPFAARA